jgi:fatty acid CoA ligase FadD36
MYFGVPTVWSRIVAAPEHAATLSSARLLVSGSAALPVTVFERLRASSRDRCPSSGTA